MSIKAHQIVSSETVLVARTSAPLVHVAPHLKGYRGWLNANSGKLEVLGKLNGSVCHGDSLADASNNAKRVRGGGMEQRPAAILKV
jgi:hypothetical protein